jgi:sphinganine-1-phosphate aldolase
LIQRLNGDTRTCVGCVSSGGSESILLAIKAYRDHFFARKPHFSTSEAPEIIMCRTAHPAFNKAAKLFRLNIVYVDCEADTKRMRVDQIAAKITPLTAVIIASATQYPHGVVDPGKFRKQEVFYKKLYKFFYKALDTSS